MSFYDLPPFCRAEGTVFLPGSKSISNRALLLAALSEGTTTLHHLLDSDDTRVMKAALESLGVKIEQVGEASYRVFGAGGAFPVQKASLFLGNAGTAFRSLTALLALLQGDYELTGTARMQERPIKDLVEALNPLGANISYAKNEGFPPLLIRPFCANEIKSISVPGNVSSQFLTGLLMSLPLLKKAITIVVTGDLISRPYIEMTLKVMAAFGVVITHDHFERFFIPADARYISPTDFDIEADASSASYFLALGALAGSIRIEGVGKNSIQGDVAFAHVLEKMGAKITWGTRFIVAERPPETPLKGLLIDAKEIPDAAMTFATLALFAKGPTKIINIASWRVKETDRISAMATELQKLGAKVVTGEDFIEIFPPQAITSPPSGIDTYDDHRMAMCFSLAATQKHIRINDPACVAKTFPDYFSVFASVTQEVPVITIDGPSASGKGTVAARVAKALGFHYLDSGALYRLTALASRAQNIALTSDKEEAIAQIAAHLVVVFSEEAILLDGKDVSDAIRQEEISVAASKIAALPKVRAALLFLQRSFQNAPGLVADGRDMGSVIFPAASCKVFLTASAEVRAQRRHKQLSEKGIPANIRAIFQDLEARDKRDAEREVAPLKHEADAHLLNTDTRTIQEAVDQVLVWYSKNP